MSEGATFCHFVGGVGAEVFFSASPEHTPVPSSLAYLSMFSSSSPFYSMSYSSSCSGSLGRGSSSSSLAIFSSACYSGGTMAMYLVTKGSLVFDKEGYLAADLLEDIMVGFLLSFLEGFGCGGVESTVRSIFVP